MSKAKANLKAVTPKASLITKTVAIATVATIEKDAKWATAHDAISHGEAYGFSGRHARFIFNRASELRTGQYATLLKQARNQEHFEYLLCAGFRKRTASQEARQFLQIAQQLAEGKRGQNLDVRKRASLAVANHEAAKQLLQTAKIAATTKGQLSSIERLEKQFTPTLETQTEVKYVTLVKKSKAVAK